MNFDAELMYDCLMYLNLYYFAVFGPCEFVMCLAKYKGTVDTPNIGTDAIFVGIMLGAEILKLFMYKKIRERRKVICSLLTVFLTVMSSIGLVYTFHYQQPKLKLELILCSLMTLLLITEVFFCVCQICPCCKRKEYT